MIVRATAALRVRRHRALHHAAKCGRTGRSGAAQPLCLHAQIPHSLYLAVAAMAPGASSAHPHARRHSNAAARHVAHRLPLRRPCAICGCRAGNGGRTRHGKSNGDDQPVRRADGPAVRVANNFSASARAMRSPAGSQLPVTRHALVKEHQAHGLQACEGAGRRSHLVARLDQRAVHADR